MAGAGVGAGSKGQRLSTGFGRAADYLFGRNTLIGVASLMLLAISGYATWSGMNDFIVGSSTSPVAAQGRALPGGLSVSNEFLVVAVTVTLTFLMWLALRETFGAKRQWRERALTFPLYLFLALWSVGFGYGFWWSLIAGEEATRTSFSGLQEDARDAGSAITARLDAVRIQLDNVVSWSETQMAREEASGGSCGVPSGAGRGPLYNARRSVRDAVASLRDGITRSWVGPVQEEIAQLRRNTARLGGETLAERQRNFENRAADVRGRARSIALRSNELGISTATEMRALADAVTTAPGEAGFSCYDPTLAQRLRQAASQAGQPAVLNLREAAFSEGAAGVANAVKRLWGNIASSLTNAVRVVFRGGSSAGGGDAAPGDPISGRDLIALLATLGIDLGLFVLTALNPPARAPAQVSRLNEAVADRVRRAMQTAVSRAPGRDMEWLRRHFVHHRGHSYFVAPNLYGITQSGTDEASWALALNQLTGVLDDLDLIRWPTRKEFKKLKDEEKQVSGSDLTDVRREMANELGLDEAAARQYVERKAVRNHGLFSKAERMLQFAGWGDGARADLEIFTLTDTEGLTPLLSVLSEIHVRAAAGGDGGAGTLPLSGIEATNPPPRLTPPKS